MNLTRADFDALDRSWITQQIAEAAGVYRVVGLEGRDLIGRKGGGDYSGIVFPYRMPGESHSVLDRLRLDVPPNDPSGKPAHKYLSPPGSRNRIYFPPCQADLLAQNGLPLIITEGEKKVLALWRMALGPTNGANGAGELTFLPIGLPGVWAFRGTTGIQMTVNGERVPQKGILPDFDRIAWLGRRVTILYDANAATNLGVQAARRELARELTHRGADVWIAELPAQAGINGCDDFLHLYGPAQLETVIGQAHRYEWRLDLIVTEKGKVMAILANAITALRAAPEWVGVLSFDEFALNVSARQTPWGAVTKWTERDDCLLADWLQHRGIRVGDIEAGKAVVTVAKDHPYHPVRQYLESLRWDGTPRVDKWLKTYLGVADSDVTRAFGSKWLISAVARIFHPGAKADHCLIVEGPQGALKSTAFRVLGAPWFTDEIADLGSKDASLATIGVWLIELPELDAFGRAEMSRIKSFMSRTSDRFRPPYGRYLIDSPRQCIFAGTVNHSQYLRDETGGRRFWPVFCGQIRTDALREDRDQLWAETVHRYRSDEHWWLESTELNQAASEVQDERYLADAWQELIANWIEGRTGVTTAELLAQALNKPAGTWTRGDEMRVAAILRKLNWEAGPRVGTTDRKRVYRPTSD